MTTSISDTNAITLFNGKVNDAIRFIHTRSYTTELLHEQAVLSFSKDQCMFHIQMNVEMLCSNDMNHCKHFNEGDAKPCANQVCIIDEMYIHIDNAYLEQLGMQSYARNNRTLAIDKSCRQTIQQLGTYDISTTYYKAVLIAYLNILSIQLLQQESRGYAQKKYTNKFLNTESEQQKIVDAHDYILANIGSPVSIKQLSKIVAINECYLKKGFKEMYKKSIKEFYQHHRMNFAKKQLIEQQQTVTAVAQSLGFSSISHFSSAFKKHTGLKPCELLLA